MLVEKIWEIILVDCSDSLHSNKEIEIDIPSDSILEMDRGKLMLPSEYALVSVVSSWHILQNYVTNSILYF